MIQWQEVKPKATYCLTKDQKLAVCVWLKNLGFPDGYVSNISRRVNLQQCRVSGLKSRDCHVFMQRLLPIAFHDFLPENIWGPITEISNFFRAICASEIRVSDMEALEKSIVVTMCKLEKILPPAFFDSMEHLVLHLPYEAKIRGPVQYGWMYPFEWRMFDLKGTVHNKARVEGSICEAYLLTEITNFCSHYFDINIDIETRSNSLRRNNLARGPESDSQLSIFTSARQLIGSKIKRRVLSIKEYNAAQAYILLNCNLFDEQIGANDLSDAEVSRRRHIEFVPWFKKLASSGDVEVDPLIWPLVVGPIRQVDVYKGYMVNGFRFHTKAHGLGKKTSSATTGAPNETSFYGMLQEVIELEYWGSGYAQNLFLFNCDWYDITRGNVVVHPKYHLIDINPRKILPDTEPFIFASQASQVYYVPYPAQTNPRRKGWWNFCPIKARHMIDVSSIEQTKAEEYYAQQVYQDIDPLVVNVSDDVHLLNLSNGETEIVVEEPDQCDLSDPENDLFDDRTLGIQVSDDEE